MDIIISHDHTDLDGLAAMIAARHLYEDAVPVFVGRLHPLTRDFMALYRDEIEVASLSDIDLEDVERVILVDTADRNRLGRLSEELDWHKIEVIVYDHHPHDGGTSDWIDLDMSREVGSATTILINRLLMDDIQLDPVEATLCALGIYADTGNFTHLSTSPLDLRAVAYLLDAGAHIRIINQFLEEKLDEEQEKALEKLIKNREDLQLNGTRVSIFYADFNEYIMGLNRVVGRLKDLYDLPSVFILAGAEDKVDLIGRSSDEAVDVGRICGHFQGGGHSGAGSARLELSLQGGLKELKKALEREITRQNDVRSIMSSPVRTIDPDTTVARAEEMMEKYGHNGLVVVREDEIEGIFSRRDLDKIKGHDLMNAPVRGYMSRDVVTIEASSSIREAQELMVKYDIGRLPIMEEGRMVGIVTRTDILASYYDDVSPHHFQNRYGTSMVEISERTEDISSELDKLPYEMKHILSICSRLAEEQGIPVYLVGGMVRDLLLGRENSDIDLVIEGETRPFLAGLADELEADFQFHERFQTGSITLRGRYSIDVARTRSEFYPSPGARPEVERAGLLEDLFRRDFTINAMALALSPGEQGRLYDFFNARSDLEEGRIKALHRFSFLDDPIRIIRGIRYALELDFELEEETEKLMDEALRRGDFSRLKLSRVYEEIRDLVRDFHHREDFVEMLQRLPAFKLLAFEFDFTAERAVDWKNLEDSLAYLRANDYNIIEWEVKIAFLMKNMPPVYQQKLSMSEEVAGLIDFAASIDEECEEISETDDPLRIYERLEGLSPEELALLHCFCGEEEKESIEYFCQELSSASLEIDGNDLIEMGLEPGPVIQEILDEIWAAYLRGEIESREEQLELARRLTGKITGG